MKRYTKNFLLTCFAFLLGVLIIIPFADAKYPASMFALTGFLLCTASFVYALTIGVMVSAETRTSYIESDGLERKKYLYINRLNASLPILLCLLIFYWSYTQKDFDISEYVNLSGIVSEAYYSTSGNSTLFIHLDNNTNRFGIMRSRIPKDNLEIIENNLQKGSSVELSIKSSDEKLEYMRNINFYRLKVNNRELISASDYNRSIKSNRSIGYFLGVICFIGGVYYFNKYKI
ncbi:MAG: hypothetical protein LAT75_12000 [Candidatus Cyclonatronum sp.]|jgi:hypothetical protein|uniref:hypothetical protein n=1 Tax=Cyclonatronum sp. TaxID=3024185 RepID=UPI0025BC5434|nr:hypothetical protein [Cyclonatronum sp.]MCH8487582.1 hypothetical protein [Cyclonatronum sp.]